MIKIIISALLILLSVFIYFKLSSPLLIDVKNSESANLFLEQKINSYNNQMTVLKDTKIANIILKKRRVSTYVFTLLSFVNYLKSEGFNINIKFKRMNIPFKNPASDKTAVGINAPGGFEPYETNTKFNGVKKIGITLIFKGYPGIEPALSVMNKLYILFPIGFTGFKINKKITLINFNLYSFKGV